MKRIGLILAAAVFVVTGCSSTATSTSTPTAAATKAAALATPTTAVDVSAAPAKAYKAGDVITVTNKGADKLRITISDVKTVDKFEYTGTSEVPETAGNVFVYAKVSYEALADGQHYSELDWDTFVSSTAVDSAVVFGGPTPELNFGDLAKGQKAAGYMVWEVAPKGDIVMSYKYSAIDDNPTFTVVIRAA